MRTVHFHKPLRAAQVAGNPAAAQVAPRREATPAVAAAQAPEAASEPPVTALLNEIAASIEQLEERRRELAAELKFIAVEIGVAAAEKVIGQQVEAGQLPLAAMVDALIEPLGVTGPVTVTLNPADLELVRSQRAAVPEGETGQPEWQLTAHPQMPRGRCQVTAAERGFFYDTRLQLAEIRQLLWENLNEAENERRVPRGGDSQLRRFPERRATG
jgi:flagellar biosynthesis/type III secretory pathway protein FliH